MGRNVDNITKATELAANIRSQYDELSSLLESVSGEWGFDDVIYRFYSQSWRTIR
jgi:hypothetical protein